MVQRWVQVTAIKSRPTCCAAHRRKTSSRILAALTYTCGKHPPTTTVATLANSKDRIFSFFSPPCPSQEFLMKKNSCTLSVHSSSFSFCSFLFLLIAPKDNFLLKWKKNPKKQKNKKISLWWERMIKNIKFISSISYLVGCVFPLEVAWNRLVLLINYSRHTLLKGKQQKEAEGSGSSHHGPCPTTPPLLQGYPLEVINTLSFLQVLFFCRPICKIGKWHFPHAQEHQEFQKRSIYKMFWITE